MEAIFGGFPETMGQKKLLQELESTANASDFALAQQSYAIRNMLSSRVLIAGKYARKDVRKQGLGIVRTRKTCKISRCCLAGVRSKTGKHHNTLGFHGVFARRH